MAAHFLQRSRHQSVYYFRRRVPDCLRVHTKCVQIYRSLGTTDRREAVQRARVLAVESDRLFTELTAMAKRKPPPSFGYTLKLTLDQFGHPQELAVDAKPHEQDAVNSAIATALQAARGATAGATPPSDAQPAPILAPTISDAVIAYKSAAGVRPTTARRYAPVLAGLEAFFGGNTSIGAITQSRFADYAAVINADDNKAGATKKLYVTTAGRFFNWCTSRYDAAPTISTKTLKAKRTAPASHDRAAYSLKELHAVMNAALAVKKAEPHKFWITALGIFTGMRLEEMAQLAIENIQTDADSGHWYVDINGDNGRSVKTFAGWRRVPLLPALIDAGMPAYLNSIKSAGHQRVFPQWKPRMDPTHGGMIYGHKISRWGGKQLTKLRSDGSVTTPKLSYFHSMRHTFVNRLKQKKADPLVVAAIVGHERGGIDQNRYGKQYELKLLVDILLGSLGEYRDLLGSIEADRFSAS